MSRTHLIRDLQRFEGYSGRPYRCPAGFVTIGYGRNLDANPVTLEEATYLLMNDIDRAEIAAIRAVPSFHYHDELRRDVLIQMAFQMGEAGLASFRQMIAALQVADYGEAARQMRESKWWREDSRSRAEELARRMETGRREDE